TEGIMNRLLAALLTLGTAVATVEGREPQGTRAVVAGQNRFALALYARLADEEGNLFFSPFSISTALSMTSAGARGAARERRTRPMYLPEQEKLPPALGELLRQVNGPGHGGYQLNTANALWGQQGHLFKAEFLTLTRNHYGAGFNEVDFRHATE